MVELRRAESELHPPAYLAIHITFSLLPPLSTLSSHLEVYKARFRVWDISRLFFSILTNLKAFITVPSVCLHTTDDTSKISATEALALSVEAGLLLDQMIDISVEQKCNPIPDEWIDEFETTERKIQEIARDEFDRPQTPSLILTEPWMEEFSEGAESPEVPLKRELTAFSAADSVFSASPRSEKLDDSISSIEDDLPQRVKPEHNLDEELRIVEVEREEREFDLQEALREDDERIFDEQYNPTVTPPRKESPEQVDHSPFLEGVIAELEELDPLESLQQQVIEDLEAKNVGAPIPISEKDRSQDVKDGDIDIDALYKALVNGANADESDDEELPIPSIVPEICTSSPVLSDHESDYDELRSNSDESSDNDDTTRYDGTVVLNSHDKSADETTSQLNTLSVTADKDKAVTQPRSSPRKYPRISRTPSPPALTIPPTPPSLKDSHLHSRVSQIAESHPTVALIPQSSTFRPNQSSEYGYYTLRPTTSHSRHSSISSDNPEPRRVDVAGVNLYVRVLSDRVMVRVGGGWVDLEQYLVEYVGKREYRRRSGSVEPMAESYEVVDLDERRNVSNPVVLTPEGRTVSSLGFHSSPSGRISAMEFRRSVSPAFEEGGSIGRTGGMARRVYVRRK